MIKNKKLIILIICFASVTVLSFLVFKGITIRNIVVVGNKNLSQREIRSILGIREGHSIIYPSSK
ncbi:MAG TPA: FtsQ-type POTRA domain-containing protein, partial [Thermodesulfovibrio thiophilus]|nr:FtsQ-type POTRA domain-containing protein [Thermodesulfovibrio thiophilus]